MYLQRPNIHQRALGDSTEKKTAFQQVETSSRTQSVSAALYSLYKYICTSMQSVAKDTMLISKVFWLLFVDELTSHMWVGLLMVMTIDFDVAI